MVDVRVTNSETRKSITVVAATAQALLEVVQSSRHFGPGTLEDASERLVSDGYALSDGLELTWFPKAAAAAQPPAALPGAGAGAAHPRRVQGIDEACASGNVIPAWQHQPHQHQQRGATLRHRRVGG